MKKQSDAKSDEVAFEVVNREVDLLLKRLRAKGVCPCCAAQCLDIADTLDPDNGATPASDTQH